MDIADVLKTFRLVASEFAEVPDDTVNGWILLTEPFVSRKRFKKFWTQALALLTAHRMKLASVGTEPGMDPLEEVANIGIGGFTRVSNYSEGSTSIGFNNNITQLADLNAEYSLTPYGIQYLSLLRMRIMSITSAGGSNGRA